jgi:hypothetical protein
LSGAWVRGLIADLAISFHWQPSEIRALSVEDAIEFREEARKRLMPKR